jgi:hypothetical protein
MARPQVIVIPPLSGIGAVMPAQIPLTGTTVVTLVNLDRNLGVTLCNTTDFAPNTTWPLGPSNVIPQPGVNNLWVQNPNTEGIEILVLEGIVPVTNFYSSGVP